MKKVTEHIKTPPFQNKLPAPIFFRTSEIEPKSAYLKHRHDWGEFVYSYTGVLEIELHGGEHFLVPPQYGIWLKPGEEHASWNQHATSHGSFYMERQLCNRMPDASCALMVSPLIRALLDELRNDPPDTTSISMQMERMLWVLADKLATASLAGNYLPGSSDPILGNLLNQLKSNPGDPRSLAEIAKATNFTERTLTRRFNKELGMSFVEWRLRAKVVEAFDLLEKGKTVESISYDLGYSGPSAFISMFRKMTGSSPDQYRKRNFGA